MVVISGRNETRLSKLIQEITGIYTAQILFIKTIEHIFRNV